MEEIRRLRMRQRTKNAELAIFKEEPENELPNFRSFIPFMTSATLRVCYSLIAGNVLFGGFIAPGEHKRCKYCLGTGYIACARCSNSGSLVLIEPVWTVHGGDRPLSTPKTEICSYCSGSGKTSVMCPTCLCTGMAMAGEHPRIDPID